MPLYRKPDRHHHRKESGDQMPQVDRGWVPDRPSSHKSPAAQSQAPEFDLGDVPDQPRGQWRKIPCTPEGCGVLGKVGWFIAGGFMSLALAAWVIEGKRSVDVPNLAMVVMFSFGLAYAWERLTS